MESSNVSQLKRSLKARHLSMISLGGTIGTGLFLASGGAIHQLDLVEHWLPMQQLELWFIS